MLPLAHKRLWLAASTALLALVVYASLGPSPALSTPGNFDKLGHFGAYLCLAVWFTALYPRSKYWRVAVGLLALGLAMEVLQHVMARGRYGDPRDMAANASGVLLGCGLAIAATGSWAARVDAWLSRS